MKNLTITLPDEVEQYEHDIRRFVDAMVFKLKIHAGKGRWEEMPMGKALTLMDGERQELIDAIVGRNLMEILTEAADVANFCLIISAIAIERGPDED